MRYTIAFQYGSNYLKVNGIKRFAKIDGQNESREAFVPSLLSDPSLGEDVVITRTVALESDLV